jgi:hypothetical protein
MTEDTRTFGWYLERVGDTDRTRMVYGRLPDGVSAVLVPNWVVPTWVGVELVKLAKREKDGGV